MCALCLGLRQAQEAQTLLLRPLQYQGGDTCSLREKNTNLVCLEPYLEFEGMSFKVVWESFSMTCLLIRYILLEERGFSY